MQTLEDVRGVATPSPPPRIELDDRLVRAVAIPALGIVVPRVSGVLDGLSPDAPEYWLGSAWAVVTVAAICHGTRAAYLAHRRAGDWAAHPSRKLVSLLALLLLLTAAPTGLSFAGWSAVLGTAVWRAGLVTFAVAVVGVVLMAFFYEFVFLLKERAADRSRLAGLGRACAEAELAASRAQVDPHFLFNSLNTLGHLITTDPTRASLFNAHLAELHRYVLQGATTELVSLQQELQFLESYVALMTIRFASAFRVTVVDRGADRRARLPPTALQTLVENAIKHNVLLERRPLLIVVTLGAESVVVCHAYRPRRTARASAGGGLRNLDERVQLTSARRIAVERRGGLFAVTVPLLPPAGSRPLESSSPAHPSSFPLR